MSVIKQRMASPQSLKKRCLECLIWAELWLPGLRLWPRKLWRERVPSLPPLDWSRRIQPNKVRMPQRYRMLWSPQTIPTSQNLQRRTRTTRRLDGFALKAKRSKHSVSLCQVPSCLVSGPSWSPCSASVRFLCAVLFFLR